MLDVRDSLLSRLGGSAGFFSGLRLLCILCIVAGVFFSASGCSYPALDLPLHEPVHSYKGTWFYRYGESPVRDNGTEVWAELDTSSHGWNTATTTHNPPGRVGDNTLWLRTIITEKRTSNSVMYFDRINEGFDLYINGKRYNGSQQPAVRLTRKHYDGPQILFLPLPAGEIPVQIVFKIKSQRKVIGIPTSPLIGGAADLLLYKIIDYQFYLSTGLFIIGMGVVGLVIYSMRRREFSYLFFALLCFSFGIYISVASSGSISVFFPYIGFWWEVEIVSLYLIGMFSMLFFRSIFGSGPAAATTRITYAYMIFGIFLLICVLSSLLSFSQILPAIQLVFLFCVIYLCSYSFAIALTGNVDARIFGVGFIIATLPAVYTLLSSMGFLHSQLWSVPFSALVVVMTNVVIMARRFRTINKRVRNYSSMLQVSLANLGRADEQVLADHALKIINQILPVSKSAIYINNGQKGDPVLLAEEPDASAAPTDHARPDELPVQNDYRRDFAVMALEKRKPIGGIIPSVADIHNNKRTQSRGAGNHVRRALSTLLIAQEQILGALYVELKDDLASLSNDDNDLLNGLSQQIAMSLIAARAGQIVADSAVVQRKMNQQKQLLLAAARLAEGDLDTEIQAPAPHELGELAAALEHMRKDLKAKIQRLENNNQEIRELNDELRRQIDQRSRRVLDFALSSEDKRTQRRSSFFAGDQLGDYYTIIRLLGQGATGSVYEVKRTTDGRLFAAKVLTARADRTAMVRFVREAQLLARLTHPNLVSIVDVDVNSDGVLYLVMELIHGQPLKNCMKEYSSIPLALDILCKISSGLAAVHLAGIVHRDLKPANVLIEHGPADLSVVVKLVDFGFSTLARGPNARSQLSSTKAPLPMVTGEIPIVASARSSESTARVSADYRASAEIALVVGTPMYMAPEFRKKNHAPDASADIFSFGVLAYELLTGTLPFETPLVFAAADAPSSSVAPLRKLVPDLPEEITAIIERTLSRTPEARPQAQEIAQVLGDALQLLKTGTAKG